MSTRRRTVTRWVSVKEIVSLRRRWLTMVGCMVVWSGPATTACCHPTTLNLSSCYWITHTCHRDAEDAAAAAAGGEWCCWWVKVCECNNTQCEHRWRRRLWVLLDVTSRRCDSLTSVDQWPVSTDRLTNDQCHSVDIMQSTCIVYSRHCCSCLFLDMLQITYNCCVNVKEMLNTERQAKHKVLTCLLIVSNPNYITTLQIIIKLVIIIVID